MKLCTLAVVAGLVVPLALSSCISLPDPPLQIRESSLSWRVVEASDSLEWVSVDRGIGGKREAKDQVQQVLDGRRIYPAEGGWMHVDFDDLPDVTWDDPHMAALASLQIEFAQDLHVVDTGLAQDELGETVLWRRTRVNRAAHWLKTFQQFEQAPDEGLTLGEFPTFDQQSLDLVLQARRSGDYALSIEGSSLVFAIPSTQDNARCCEEHLQHQPPPILGDMIELRSPICEFTNGRFVARYEADARGWFVGPWSAAQVTSNTTSSPFLAAELRKAHLLVQSNERFRARLDELGLALP